MEIISLIPLLFLIPPLPYINRFFKGIDVSKFSYGAATSGILLTFYGVWIGLAGFDVNNIESSIPDLLAGLRTAFGSSLVGLGTSMVINLFFVDSRDDTERSLDELLEELRDLNLSLTKFSESSTEANVEALSRAINHLISEVEMGINAETQEVMKKFRTSTENLCEFQQKHIEEIKTVTEAMDRNAEVTNATTAQLDKTNKVLDRIGPVTEDIAKSIGYVQVALPRFRARFKDENLDE